jgi:hypothetical protein
MGATKHTVVKASGIEESVSINHACYAAVQYDFYIPSTIWSHQAVQTFLNRLLSIEPGATIFTTGLIGLWRGDTEQTQIYRFILRTDRLQKETMAAALRSEIGQLMADLAATPLRQNAFCYTATEMTMNTAEPAGDERLE